MKLTLGLYGLFVLLVVINGNGKNLVTLLQNDAGGYLPWLIVAAVLGGFYQFEATHDLAQAFLILVVVSFVIKNIDGLKSSINTIYSTATKGTPL